MEAEPEEEESVSREKEKKTFFMEEDEKEEKKQKRKRNEKEKLRAANHKDGWETTQLALPWGSQSRSRGSWERRTSCGSNNFIIIVGNRFLVILKLRCQESHTQTHTDTQFIWKGDILSVFWRICWCNCLVTFNFVMYFRKRMRWSAFTDVQRHRHRVIQSLASSDFINYLISKCSGLKIEFRSTLTD